MRKKGFENLSRVDVERIKLAYLTNNGSLRELGRIYGVSHETIRKAVKQDICTPGQSRVKELIDTHWDNFLLAVRKGVSPMIAAGCFGVTQRDYIDYMLPNEELQAAIHQGACVSLAKAEMCLASASGEEWKAALERLKSVEQTRHLYQPAERVSDSKPSISINMNWNRDEMKVVNE